MHYLEAWNEAVADGAWGALASAAAERLRQGLDLEHWAAFGDSLRALERLLGEIAAGERGAAPGASCCSPATCTTPTSPGAAHRRAARVAGARLPGRLLSSARSAGLDEKRAIKLAMTGGAELVGHGLARAAGVQEESLTWEIVEGPWFDDQLATLHLDGRRCTFRLEKALGGGAVLPTLQQVALRPLA